MSSPRLWRVEIKDDFGGLHTEIVHATNRDDAMVRAGILLAAKTGIPHVRAIVINCEDYSDVEEGPCTGSTSTTST